MRRNPGQRTRTPRVAVIICAAVVAATGAAAAGCRPAQHLPATLPHASCGSAVTHFLTGHTQLLHADPGALACFARAARDCKPASLRVTAMGVDTGTDYVFSIEPGTTPCQVTQARQDYSANFGGSHGAVTTVPCHRATVTPSGVTLSCRGQDVLIPATVGAPSPRPA